MESNVILLAGPAGAGKTTMAARIAEHPSWEHLSEDDEWVKIKEGRPPHELRTPEEESIVRAQVVERLMNVLKGGKNAVLEFILYDDPPSALLHYQQALSDRDIRYITKILRPDVNEILRRIDMRGREEARATSS